MKEHLPQIELREPLPEEIDAGGEILIKVRASCPAGCDLRGAVVRILSGDETLGTTELRDVEEGRWESELAVTVPREVGEHTLTIVLEGHEADGALHGEVQFAITVNTRAHLTSLAAWGESPALVIGRAYEVHIGARCSAGCDLGGNEIIVYDETGEVAARALLGDTPLEGTDALYWTKVEVLGPDREGPTSWSVGFAPTAEELPHTDPAFKFSATAVAPPEHTVTIRVVERESRTPLEGARVMLSAYRGVTDAAGVARVPVPTGTFDLVARMVAYLPYSSSAPVEVEADLTLDVELEREPEKHPYADWM